MCPLVAEPPLHDGTWGPVAKGEIYLGLEDEDGDTDICSRLIRYCAKPALFWFSGNLSRTLRAFASF